MDPTQQIDRTPGPLIETILAWLEDMDANALKQLAVACPRLFKGFRPGRASPSLIVTNLRKSFRNAEALPPEMAALAHAYVREFLWLGFISPGAMPFMLECFGDALGRKEACAAALLHEDEECRELARVRWAEWAGTTPDAEAAKKAASNLRAFCGIVIAALDERETATDDATPTEPKPPPRSTTAPEPSPEPTQKLREAERDLKRARREAQEAKAETERLSKQVSTLKSAKGALEVDLRDTRTTLRELEEGHQARIKVAAQRLADERLMPWLTDCEQLAEVDEAARASDLLERVESTLLRQTKRDRAYSTRSRLAKRIEECRQALSDVESAAGDSLRPLPELRELAEELATEIQNLEAKLAPSKSANQPDAELHRRITRARTQRELAETRKYIAEGLADNTLAVEDREAIFSRLIEASHSLFNQARFAAEKSDVAQEMACNPGVDFYQRLQLDEPLLLILDGHNFLGTLLSGTGLRRRSDWYSETSRESLKKRLAEFGNNYPELRIDLWFDGPVATQHNETHNLRVCFSGGTGSDRADKAILQSIEHQKGAVRVFLVTADRGEATKAERLGAKVLLPEELEHLLS